jgi:hypothetical protein
MNNNNFITAKQELFRDPDIQVSIQKARELANIYVEPLPVAFTSKRIT